MRGAYIRSGLVPGGHTSDQAARRAAAIEQIQTMLTERSMSCFDLSASIGIPSGTVYGYLKALEEEGDVYQLDGTDARGRRVWAADSEAKRIATDRAQAKHERRVWVAPARQIGMQRHWMDEALFGPAQGQPTTQQG